MSKTDDQLRGEISINEARAEWGAWAIVIGLVFEVVIALTVSFDVDKKWIDNWGAVIADCLIALGVYAEIHFGRKASDAAHGLQQRSDVKIAEANARAEEAQARAAEADRARVELESRLQPRTLTQEQIDMIEGLRGKFAEITVARETDIETHLFAQQISLALTSAGIRVSQYLRAADVHTAGIQIREPVGFDGSRPKIVEPLVDVFSQISPSLITIAGPMPPDIPASSEIPMIIVGGRLVLPIADSTIFSRLLERIDANEASNRPQSTNEKRE